MSLRWSKPRSNRSNVEGPGAMKKTNIQMGQWARRYAGLFRSRSFRPLASSTLTTRPEKAGYCPAGLAAGGFGAAVAGPAGALGAGAEVAGAALDDTAFLSYSSMISLVMSILGEAH